MKIKCEGIVVLKSCERQIKIWLIGNIVLNLLQKVKINEHTNLTFYLTLLSFQFGQMHTEIIFFKVVWNYITSNFWSCVWWTTITERSQQEKGRMWWICCFFQLTSFSLTTATQPLSPYGLDRAEAPIICHPGGTVTFADQRIHFPSHFL